MTKSHLPWRGPGWRGPSRTRWSPGISPDCRGGHSATSRGRKDGTGGSHWPGWRRYPGRGREGCPPGWTRRPQGAARQTPRSPGSPRSCLRKWRWRVAASQRKAHSSQHAGSFLKLIGWSQSPAWLCCAGRWLGCFTGNIMQFMILHSGRQGGVSSELG